MHKPNWPLLIRHMIYYPFWHIVSPTGFIFSAYMPFYVKMNDFIWFSVVWSAYFTQRMTSRMQFHVVPKSLLARGHLLGHFKWPSKSLVHFISMIFTSLDLMFTLIASLEKFLTFLRLTGLSMHSFMKSSCHVSPSDLKLSRSCVTSSVAALPVFRQ